MFSRGYQFRYGTFSHKEESFWLLSEANRLRQASLLVIRHLAGRCSRGKMNRARILLFLWIALGFGLGAKADTIDNLPVPLGTVDATIGLTPIKDSSSGFGRFFLSYVLNGYYNGFVFWVSNDDPTGQPFAVSNGQVTFVRGAYDHYIGGILEETLSIVASPTCCTDIFSFNRGELIFDLPSSVTPTTISGGGDEFYILNVPVLISNVPPLPETITLLLLGTGLVGLLTYDLRRRLKSKRKLL